MAKKKEEKKTSKKIHISMNNVGNSLVVDLAPTFNVGSGKTVLTLSPDLRVKF